MNESEAGTDFGPELDATASGAEVASNENNQKAVEGCMAHL
jgi:hypothetical protein